MNLQEWLPTITVVVSAAIWVINLMITNRSLKDKIERLEKENAELHEYAKHSKP